jgi:hypothetical protein
MLDQSMYYVLSAVKSIFLGGGGGGGGGAMQQEP